jgi:hypothetical protein
MADLLVYDLFDLLVFACDELRSLEQSFHKSITTRVLPGISLCLRHLPAYLRGKEQNQPIKRVIKVLYLSFFRKMDYENLNVFA